MAAASAHRPATAAQVAAWKKRMGYSNPEAAEQFGVHTRTFTRWLSGEAESPKWLGDKFRNEGVKR